MPEAKVNGVEIEMLLEVAWPIQSISRYFGHEAEDCITSYRAGDAHVVRHQVAAE
jgi:hypothetical protein